jgi:uncharacterized protein involved in response to NO
MWGMRPGSPPFELRLRRVVRLYIITGLLFMLLPGTFLGVWNLISISDQHSLNHLSPAWIQAHGHAQVFGWIGTFILGIGFHSLSKMGRISESAIRRAWMCYGLWITGLILRWTAGVTEYDWRVILPASAVLELAGFLTFYRTVSGHKQNPGTAPRKPQPWMLLVIAGTIGFMAALIANVWATFDVAIRGIGPAIPHGIDQRLLILPAWGFLVPTVWGFNARWFPAFLGVREPRSRGLLFTAGLAFSAVILVICGFPRAGSALLPLAAIASMAAMRIMERPERVADSVAGVHPSFGILVRGSYLWLLVASVLSVWAAIADRSGGIWGASRHALTVGFIATMVFAVGHRILPGLCGARTLFSTNLMLASLVLLNLGCVLRVSSEIPAYEGFSHQAWSVLPVSAITELMAVTLFAANLLLTFARPLNHLMRAKEITA